MTGCGGLEGGFYAYSAAVRSEDAIDHVYGIIMFVRGPLDEVVAVLCQG